MTETITEIEEAIEHIEMVTEAREDQSLTEAHQMRRPTQVAKEATTARLQERSLPKQPIDLVTTPSRTVLSFQPIMISHLEKYMSEALDNITQKMMLANF